MVDNTGDLSGSGPLGGNAGPSGGNAVPPSLASDAAAHEAARERRRRAAVAQRNVESATVVSALLGAAATEPVELVLVDGSTLAGVVTGVGEDVVEVDSAGARWWVSLPCVDSVVTGGALAGDPADRHATTLAELVADLVHDGSTVTVRLRSGAQRSGEVVGADAALVIASVPADGRAAVDAARVVVAWPSVAAVLSPRRRRSSTPTTSRVSPG